MKRLLGDTAVYGISSVLQKALGFVLLPVYTRHLSRAEYGVVAFIVSVMAVVEVFVTCCASSGITRFYYEHDPERRSSLACSALLFSLATGLLVAGIGLCLAPWLADRVWRIADGTAMLRVAFLGLFFGSVGQIFPNLLRLGRRKWTFVILSVINMLLTAAFMVYWVVFARQGALGMVLGTTCGAVTQFVLFGAAALGQCRGRPSRGLLKQVLSFSIPIVFVGLSGIVKNQTDKWFLKYFCDLEALGLYAIGEKFASIVALLGVTTFTLAWSPYILGYAKEEDRQKRILAEVSDAYLFSLLLMAMALSAFGPHVLRAMSPPAFHAASRVILPLCMIWVFMGIGYVWVVGVHMALMTKYLPVFVFVGLVVNIALNALMIPPFGIVGAAAASGISSAVISVQYLWFSQRHFPVAYHTKRMAWCLCLFGVLMAGVFVAHGRTTLWVSGAVGVLAVAAFLAFGFQVMLPAKTRGELLAVLRGGR